MNVTELPAVRETIDISREIYARGWGEANGGNISIRVPPDEIGLCSQQLQKGEVVSLPYATPGLAGEFFLVTGTGVFFRHIFAGPEKGLGLVQLNDRGDAYTHLWGLADGGKPTSELPSHLLSHEVRKKVSGGTDRAVLHIHATSLIALSFVLPLDTAVITRELWEMMSECLMLFPEGIGVMDWMIPGKPELGYATADLMQRHRLVLWAHHGIFGGGENLNKLFGLIETADKAAFMLLQVLAAGGKKQTVSAAQLRALAAASNIIPFEEALY
ncbi:MAG: rhamnulose-1-phosphate aldolase [Deltaproteobacteria bacterium]|nr:MAG: rhamnulose-1-phosphate aldolase [Deltaproteobacteria bacterium]